jgi:hypothetical protein
MIGQDVNKQIAAKTSENSGTGINPFPGLRPFSFEESYLFYGQDKICDQVILKLLANKFVCLLGGAGVGKTSLINCGIKPFILSGLLSGPETTWHIFHTRPGTNPVHNLAHVIYTQKYNEYFEENQRLQEQICISIIQRGRQGLIELLSQLNYSGDHKFLFIIDQFEDLFRLRNQPGETDFYEEALQYVNLFVETLRSDELQAYVVISIRSDFTDDCVMFPALAEYINLSNVIIPKMSRQQLREAILSPLRAFHVTMDDAVLTQMLNDASSSDDPLPRLQHALQRTWESWKSLNNWDKPVSIKEYEAGGGIKNSISDHANAIYDSLSEDNRKHCEIIFKALTERGSENKGLSRPTTVGGLSEIARINMDEVIRIVKIFSQPGATFLSYNNDELQPATLVDLSHVSLMRAWNKLRDWVEDEAISSQMYRQLSLAAATYQVGKTGLLRPPDLEMAMNWKEKQKPTLHWAKRYYPAFERTMVYLRTSLENYEAEEALKRKKAKQALHRVRSFTIVLGSTAVLALALTIYSQIIKRNAEHMKLIAMEQKFQADAKSEKAEKLSKEALEEKWRAELAANEAERMRLQALEQNKELFAQKSIAETTAEQAIRKSAETEKTLDQVSKQKEQIEQSALQANIQKSQAEKEKDEAFKKRMLTIAQSLAVKSQQISGNKNLKAALAVHAFEFNNTYGGPDFNPDIYYALSTASNEMGQNVRTSLKGHSGSVKAMVASPRGTILYTTGGDGNVFAWNTSDLNEAPRLIWKNVAGNLCLAINYSGRYLAVGSDNGTIQIIDLNYPEAAPVKLKGHQGPVYSLAYSRDGHLYSSGPDKVLLNWNISSGSSVSVLSEPVTIRALSISPDGRFLACGADDGRILLLAPNADQVSTLSDDNTNPIYSLAFNNNGTLLISGDIKGKIKLWNPYARKLVAKLRSPNARVVDITFSPMGDLMATSSYDGTAFIFDSHDLSSPPIILREPSSWILSVSFSSDGKNIFLATNKPDYMLSYPARGNMIVNQICPKLPRGLSTDEWNNYIGNDIKYKKNCE